MNVQLYRSQGRVFAVMEQGRDQPLPERYGPWTPFKAIELIKGQPTPGLDVDECLDDIDRFGIHITDAHVRITEDALKG